MSIPAGEHDAITIVGWYDHAATNDYVSQVAPQLTYTPLAVQRSNPDLLLGTWGDGIEGGANLTTSFSTTNITFATYTNEIAAAAWPHGVWTVAGWTSNACTLNLSGIDYTLGPGTFNHNLMAGATHDCILTGTGLVSIGIAQAPCHEFFEARDMSFEANGGYPKTLIYSTNGISFWSLRIKLESSKHISDYDMREINHDWLRGDQRTNNCSARFNSRGVYQLLMTSRNNSPTKYETHFDYRVYGYRLTDDQLERIYQNGRNEVIRRGLEH